MRLWSWLLLAVLAAFAADCLSLGAARFTLRMSPQTALAARPSSADAAAAVAQQRLLRGDAAGAAALARQGVATDPRNLAALRVLGLALAAQNRPAEASGVMRFAGDLSWRDNAVQAWLLQNSVSRGDLSDFVLRADSLLRRADNPATSPVGGMMLAAAQLAPQAVVAPLVERLAARPNWRAPFLFQLGSAPGLDQAARAVLTGLKRGPSPPTPGEFNPFVNRLSAQHQYARAFQDWQVLSAQAGRTPAALIRNGGFEQEPDGSPFDWTLLDNAGATQSRSPATGLEQGVQSLNVQYDGYTNVDLASQLLVLPAGAYALSWRERIDEGDARSLGWTVRCRPLGPVLAQAPPAASAVGTWADRRVSFIVPGTGCPAQMLQLTATPGERRTTLLMQFTGFAVTPNR